MIHFQCVCGRTVSAGDDLAGTQVACGCGESVAVPAAVIGASEVVRDGSLDAGARTARRSVNESGGHDFDAEIVGAARSAPPRPLKTPAKVDSPVAAPEAAAPAPPPFDLLRVARAARVLGPLAWLLLLLLASGAVALFIRAPAPLWLRGLGAVCLLGIGGVGFAALTALAEVCRTLAGLAQRQRELADEILAGKKSGAAITKTNPQEAGSKAPTNTKAPMKTKAPTNTKGAAEPDLPQAGMSRTIPAGAKKGPRPPSRGQAAG